MIKWMKAGSHWLFKIIFTKAKNCVYSILFFAAACKFDPSPFNIKKERNEDAQLQWFMSLKLHVFSLSQSVYV